MFRHSFNSVGENRVRAGVVGWFAACSLAIFGVVNHVYGDPPQAPDKVETTHDSTTWNGHTGDTTTIHTEEHHYKDKSIVEVTHAKTEKSDGTIKESISYKHWEYKGTHWVLKEEKYITINPPPEEGEEKSAKPWEKGGNPLDPNAFEEGPIFKAMLPEEFREKFGMDGNSGKRSKDSLINPADDSPRGTIPGLDKPKKKPLDPEKELSPDKLGLDLQETSLLNDIGLVGVLTPGYTLDQLINPDPFEQKKPDVPVPGKKPGSGPAPDDGDKAPGDGGGPGGGGLNVSAVAGGHKETNAPPNIHELALQSLVNPDPFPMGGFGAEGGFSPEGFGAGESFYGEGGRTSYAPPGQGSSSGKSATSNSLPKLSASALKHWSSLSVKRPSRPAPSFKAEAVERRPVSKPSDPTLRRSSRLSPERPMREVYRPVPVSELHRPSPEDRSPSLKRWPTQQRLVSSFQRPSNLHVRPLAVTFLGPRIAPPTPR